MMEDSDRHIAPLVAYAALVCGAAVACLALLAGPASAEGSEAPRDGGTRLLLDLDDAGDGVAEATRDVGREAGDLARQVSDPVRPVAPVVEQAAEEVVAVTDRVADQVAQVSEAVDVPAVPLPEVPVPPADPPVDPAADQPADTPGTAEAGSARDQRPRARSATSDVRPDRLADRPDPGRAQPVTTVASPDAPGLGVLEASLSTGTEAVPTAAPQGPAPLDVVAGCDDCAASGGGSGDPLHVFGLPSHGVTTPRSAADVPRSAVGGGPTAISLRPDVSPD